MSRSLIRAARWTVGGTALVLFGWLVCLALITRLAPLTGRELFAIGGGSMEPAIPMGSLVAVAKVDPTALAAGDVVAIRAANGVVVTHRISRVIDQDTGIVLELKGDANQHPDGALVSVDSVIGRAAEVLPVVGYMLILISTTAGIIAALTLVATLALLYLLVGALEHSISKARPGTPPLSVERGAP